MHNPHSQLQFVKLRCFIVDLEPQAWTTCNACCTNHIATRLPSNQWSLAINFRPWRHVILCLGIGLVNAMTCNQVGSHRKCRASQSQLHLPGIGYLPGQAGAVGFSAGRHIAARGECCSVTADIVVMSDDRTMQVQGDATQRQWQQKLPLQQQQHPLQQQ